MIVFYYHTKILNNFLCRSRLKSESLSVTYCDMTCQTKGEHTLDSERAYFWQCWGYVEPDRGPAVVLGWTPKCLRGKRFWSPIFIIHSMGFGNGRVTSQICHFPHTAHVQVWTMAHESVRPSHQTTSLLSLLKTNMAAVVLFYLVKHLGSIFYLFIYSAFIFIYKF